MEVSFPHASSSVPLGWKVANDMLCFVCLNPVFTWNLVIRDYPRASKAISTPIIIMYPNQVPPTLTNLHPNFLIPLSPRLLHRSTNLSPKTTTRSDPRVAPPRLQRDHVAQAKPQRDHTTHRPRAARAGLATRLNGLTTVGGGRE